MPVLALFFSPAQAVALTAIIHLFHNLTKLAFYGRYANRSFVLKFGSVAMLSAWPGAKLLAFVSKQQPLWTYEIAGYIFEVLPVKCLVAVVIILFLWLETTPVFVRPFQGIKGQVAAGFLSGFFGGLSGHQGAFRSAYLVHSGLSKESFLGTGIVIACLVDLIRLLVYSLFFQWDMVRSNLSLIATAVLSSFLGIAISGRYFPKMTLRSLQNIVRFFLFLMAVVLFAGLV